MNNFNFRVGENGEDKILLTFRLDFRGITEKKSQLSLILCEHSLFDTLLLLPLKSVKLKLYLLFGKRVGSCCLVRPGPLKH